MGNGGERGEGGEVIQIKSKSEGEIMDGLGGMGGEDPPPQPRYMKGGEKGTGNGT